MHPVLLNIISAVNYSSWETNSPLKLRIEKVLCDLCFLGGLEAVKGRMTQATGLIKYLDLITENVIEQLNKWKWKPHGNVPDLVLPWSGGELPSF